MDTAKRVTIYFDPDVHRALRMKAAAAERTLSEMVNEAVKISLAEDAEDLAAFAERADEPSLELEKFDHDAQIVEVVKVGHRRDVYR